jgi:transposase
MQSKETPRARRVHDAQMKSRVLAECRLPGASVAAVALAHGLNANVVHKWRRGQGLKRAALKADQPTGASAAVALADQATAVQFVAVDVPALARPAEAVMALAPQTPAARAQPTDAAVLEVQLRRGANQVTVRWPATQAAQCTQWLHELTMAVLGAEVRAP